MLSLLLGAALALSPASRTALLVGDCGPAVADQASPSDDAERIALARCRLGLQQGAAVLALVGPLKGGEYDAYAALIEGEAQMVLGRWEAAAARLAQVQGLPSETQARAALLRGRALLEAGRHDEARAQLSGLLSSERSAGGYVVPLEGADPAEIRWWLAEGAARRGQTDKAVPVWQMIWARNPTSPRAAQAAERLGAAGAPVPEARTEAGQRLIRERVASLDRLDLSKEALALRDLLPPPSSPESHKQMAKAAFRARDYARAARLYQQSGPLTPAERFDAALATARGGDYPGAARLYEALYTQLPTSPEADQASFKLGYMAWDAGELERAVGLFRDHLRRYPKSRHGDEARWFIGWSLIKLGRLPEADQALSELLSTHPSSSLCAPARYWRARIAGQRGDSAAEKAGYEAVLRSWPHSGPAWFARQRLGRSAPARSPSPLPPAPAGLAQHPTFRRGLALAEVGLDAWARAELSAVAARPDAWGEAGRLALGGALVLAGAYPRAQEIAPGGCGSPATAGASRHLCWPRPANGLPGQRAAQAGLPTNLPYAHMMAESALKPWVTSPVGARGLMQLMPELGQRRHEQLYPDSPYSPDQLYQPGYNAALGTAELISLLQRFKGSGLDSPLPAVVAGYNGGGDAVARWLEARPTEADRFAEDISYSETRRYVRNVLGYLMLYEAAWGP